MIYVSAMMMIIKEPERYERIPAKMKKERKRKS